VNTWTPARSSNALSRARERGLVVIGPATPGSASEPLARAGAFTLLEVIVACAIFFMVAFAILQLVTQSLAAAKALQQRDPDPGIILAALSLTNAFEEGPMSGNYEDIAPEMYPGHRWEAFIQEVGSNGLFEVNVVTYNERKRAQNPVTITARFWRPQSKPGSASKGQ
jgi:Tfp pilus assembly protein PilV